MDVRAFSLPGGRAGWDQVVERILWCKQHFGERTFAGPWEYNAVSHQIIVREEKNIMLYILRWQ